MAMEMPAMASSTYGSSSTALDQFFGGIGAVAINPNNQARQAEVARFLAAQNNVQPIVPNKEPIAMATQRRIVQVFVADTNENVPLADCLLYKGDTKLTDLTDQELFFEIDIKTIMDVHNAKRVKVIDKTVKERTEYLEPARIRDLKMTVVTVAQF